MILSLAFLLPAMGMMAQTQVKTAAGILEGMDLSGIHVFKGIPFAAPPVSNLRWKAPQPAAHWGGRAHGQGIYLTRCRKHSSVT